MAKMRTQFFPYSMEAEPRHFGTDFRNDVCGMLDGEGYPKFLLSGFVFTPGLLNKFSK
jgi:hypothetical protein